LLASGVAGFRRCWLPGVNRTPVPTGVVRSATSTDDDAIRAWLVERTYSDDVV
jgi:hypothetical protein